MPGKMTESEAKLIESMADDYSNVLKEAKSMGCNDIRALYNIPLKNMELIINALEKQIPKQIVTKVQAEDLKVGHVTFKAGTKTYYCPACNNAITLASSYCGWCGQALVFKG